MHSTLIPASGRTHSILREARLNEFTSLVEAIQYANNQFCQGQDYWIVLGDRNVYWVVRPPVARSLVRMGYSLAYGN